MRAWEIPRKTDNFYLCAIFQRTKIELGERNAECMMDRNLKALRAVCRARILVVVGVTISSGALGIGARDRFGDTDRARDRGENSDRDRNIPAPDPTGPCPYCQGPVT